MKTMKRSLSLILILASLVLVLASLTACGGEDGVPTGMQLAADGTDGYRVCIPATWEFVNEAEALEAYVSQVDKTGFILTYRAISGDSPEARWQADMPTLAKNLAEFTEIAHGETAVDKNSAFYAIYTYKTGDTVYRAESVYVSHSDRDYLLTFTAKDDSFKDYEKTLSDILKNTSFTDARRPVTNHIFEDENAPEGMRLASDLRIATYRLYIPEDYIVPLATETTRAYVSDADRSSVNFHGFVPTVTTVADFWASYKTELESIFNDLSILEEKDDSSFGPYENIFRATYTGKVNGAEYKVMQYFMFRDYYVYTFTYTASTADSGNGVSFYDKNLADINKIVENFKFVY